jgi:hypothetical protein
VAIVTSTGKDGKVIRHIVEGGSAPPCAIAHDANGTPEARRNTPKLRLTSERCASCFKEYTKREKREGTFEQKYNVPEPQRLKDAAEHALTPEERKALKLSAYARKYGMRAADVKSAAPAKGSATKGSAAPAAKLSKESAAKVQQARESAPAASIAESAARAVEGGANSA